MWINTGGWLWATILNVTTILHVFPWPHDIFLNEVKEKTKVMDVISLTIRPQPLSAWYCKWFNPWTVEMKGSYIKRNWWIEINYSYYFAFYVPVQTFKVLTGLFWLNKLQMCEYVRLQCQKSEVGGKKEKTGERKMMDNYGKQETKRNEDKKKLGKQRRVRVDK